MRFLVVIEAPMVRPYLFASPWLQEIRGAAALLDSLNRRETKSIPKRLRVQAYERVFLGGGAGRFLFERAEDAEDFKNAVLDRYREKTVMAHVAVQVLERKTGQAFQEWVSEGVHLARLSVGGLPVGVPIPTGGGVRPCCSCGTKSAEFTPIEHGDPRLCRACRVKRHAAEQLYSKVKPGSEHYRPLESAHNLARQYSNKFILTNLAQYNEAEGNSVYLPEDFEAIGQASQPLDYMGFIWANGNRTGEHIRNLAAICRNGDEAKRAYRAFSEITDKATRQAAVEAVLEHVDIRTEDDRDRFIPAEFILAGGENLMLAVPAQNAVDVAIHFMRAFQKKTVELQQHYIDKNDLKGFFAPEGLTASAGIVLANVHYPAGDLATLADDLMKLAKEKAAALARKLPPGEPGGEETGTLDFMVFRDGGSESIKEMRSGEYKGSSSGDKPVILTERPYTCAEADGLLQAIRAIKAMEVPRSELMALHSAAFQEPMRAQSTALAIMERLTAKGNRAQGKAPEQLLSSLAQLPFRENTDGILSTCLTELIEIYDFIQP